MTDPEETPEQEIERLRREIRDLRRLRAEMPAIILKPYVEDATKHIGEVIARLAVKPTIPASEATAALRSEAQETTQPAAPPTPPPELPSVGEKVTVAATGTTATVVAQIPVSIRSPEAEWRLMIVTEKGEILTVKPEEIAPMAGPGPTAAAPAAVKLGPGSHVKDKVSGQTGFISEIADDKAIIALDQGGFITRPLSDLEPV